MLVTCPDGMKPRTLRCALGDVTLQPGPNEVTADRALMFQLHKGQALGAWALTELPE